VFPEGQAAIFILIALIVLQIQQMTPAYLPSQSKQTAVSGKQTEMAELAEGS
jgi:hypothetical protein